MIGIASADRPQYIFKIHRFETSRVAQRKRAGPITQRSVDRNHPLLHKTFSCARAFRVLVCNKVSCVSSSSQPPIAQLVERRTVDEIPTTGILRSLVQIRLGGHLFTSLSSAIQSTYLHSVEDENRCQKWDSNPRPHSWTRMLLIVKGRDCTLESGALDRSAILTYLDCRQSSRVANVVQ